MCYAAPMTPPNKRSSLHVDLGPDLESRLRAAAAAQGLTPSQWTRSAIQRGLQSSEKGGQQLAAPAAGLANKPDRAGRLDLDTELTEMLEQIKTQGQFRSRPAALRLVLRQFLGQSTGQPSQDQAAPAAIDPTPLKEAVTALMRSNHELVPMGRNLNQVAKSLNQQRVSVKVIDVMTLQDVSATLKAHIEQAAKVTSALRSLVTPQKDAP